MSTLETPPPDRPRSHRRAADYVVLLAGVLIVAAGLAHSFVGWPMVAAELVKAGAPADLRRGLFLGWTFGGAAMDAAGILVLLAFAALGRGSRFAPVACAVVAGLYLAFGVGAYAYSRSNHFLAFIALGALLAGALAARRRRGVGA